MVKARKKESKRMTCHKKYKIRKKVREHNKKLAKQLKGSVSKKRKLDGKIPNMAPFKEDILVDAIKQQEKRNEEKKSKKKSKVAKILKEPTQKTTNLNVRKTFPVDVIISQSNVILWVVDARSVPECLCKNVQTSIKEANKDIVFILNKIDLVPYTVVKKWYAILSNISTTFMFKSTQIILTECEQIIPALKQVVAKHSGAKTLISYLKSTYSENSTKIGVIGTKQVGKCCVISTILKTCGRTKAKSSADTKLSVNIKLITTPGIIAPVIKGMLHVLSNMSLYMNHPVQVLTALSGVISKTDAMYLFTLPEYDHPSELMDTLATRYNLYCNKEPDHAAVSRLVLKHLRDSLLKFYVATSEEAPERDIPENILREVENFVYQGDALRFSDANLDIVIAKPKKKKKYDMDIDEEEDEGEDDEEDDEEDEESDEEMG